MKRYYKFYCQANTKLRQAVAVLPARLKKKANERIEHSIRNLKYCRSFYRFYKQNIIGQQVVAQLQTTENEIGQQLVEQISRDESR